MIDRTTLYYAFSTIAQTLAAGFAVLAAFVLFRLKEVEEQLRQANLYFDSFDKWISKKEIWRVILHGGGPDALDKRMCELSKKSASTSSGTFYTPGVYAGPAQKVKTYGPILNTTRNFLLWALVVTVTDIVVSLVAIPFTPVLSGCPTYALTALAVSIGLAGIALWMYARLIWYLVTVESPRPK